MASNRITIFGGSGFLGRQIVKHLATLGDSIRVAVRHPERLSSIEQMGREGQIELARADVWDEATVADAVKQSASVINAVGHYVEKCDATTMRSTARAPLMSPGKQGLPASSAVSTIVTIGSDCVSNNSSHIQVTTEKPRRACPPLVKSVRAL